MFQQVIIVGNLTANPECRYTGDGTPVTSFTVAVNKKWDGGEKVWFFKTSCWRRLAETTNQYLTKGSRVMVIGEVSAEGWTDKEGNARASLELNAFQVKFLSPKDDNQQAPQAQQEQQGDLPF
jgi:single-strand DNA-binding protein